MMPVAALLTGATVWGLIWYPYRALDAAGVGGALATTLTYAGALVLGFVLLRPKLQLSWLLGAIALAAGWANVGFTYGLMLLALAGAVVMLWQPQIGWPVPRSGVEWIALSTGAMFALSNVLIRKTAQIAIELKVLAVFFGGIVAGAVCVMVTGPAAEIWVPVPGQAFLLSLLAVVLLAVNLAVQYGLSHISANRAIVIYLFELVVTAIAAWLLADEVLTLKEWCGGIMIVAAGLLSDRLAHAPAEHVSACSNPPAVRPD